MPSAALARWRTDRLFRLSEVDAHCATIQSLVPANPTFLDESLRGFVLHLSAHFQGFCKNLYTESSQVFVSLMQPQFRATAQIQFTSSLALEKGNPSHENIKRDFARFGFGIDLRTAHPSGAKQLTELSHLIDWRNRAAHQGSQPTGGGIPIDLTLDLVRQWRSTCAGLAESLDGLMFVEMSRTLGIPPW